MIKNDRTQDVVNFLLNNKSFVRKDLCDSLEMKWTTAYDYLRRFRDIRVLKNKKEERKKRKGSGRPRTLWIVDKRRAKKLLGNNFSIFIKV